MRLSTCRLVVSPKGLGRYTAAGHNLFQLQGLSYLQGSSYHDPCKPLINAIILIKDNHPEPETSSYSIPVVHT